ELPFKIFERISDRNLEEIDSKVLRKRARVLDAATRGVRARHGDAGHILSSQRIHRDDGGHRRIDSAAKADYCRMEIALAKIIANSQGKCGEKLLRHFAFVKFNLVCRIRIDYL